MSPVSPPVDTRVPTINVALPIQAGHIGSSKTLLMLTANGGAQPVRVDASVRIILDDVWSEWLTWS